MKKPIIAMSMTVAVLLLAVTGCGGNGEHQVNLNDILMEGENYTYEGDEGDLIVLAEDGTFRSVIGNKVEDGTYKLFQTEDDSWAELSFLSEEGDEERVEEWRMTTAAGEIETVTDLNGQSFILQGTRQTLR
jgi:hypothetical protein